jgi:hypothetical protein
MKELIGNLDLLIPSAPYMFSLSALLNKWKRNLVKGTRANSYMGNGH